MPVPEPFTPVALTAGILTNIASEILRHRAQALEDTLVGRTLKWAGLIEPGFDDRLRDTLSTALALYFKAHPEYKLTGVKSFFQDPAVGRQIGDYILDRRPIDEKKIQEALDRHLGSDAITEVLLEQRGLQPKRIVPDFLECYRRVLSQQLNVPQMAIVLEIADQTDSFISEMRVNEERLASVAHQVLGRIDTQDDKLERIDTSLQAIEKHLGLDRPQDVIADEIQAALDAAPRGAIFETGGLCSGYPLHPMPDHYFVAQEFGPDRADLYNALADALAGFGVQPIRADDIYWGGANLCKVSALVQSTPFGVYQMTTSQDRNVYLVLGIAIGLGRPFVLVKDKDAEAPPLAEGLDYYPIDSYLELRYELRDRVRPFLTDIAEYRPPTLPNAGSQFTAVIAHGGVDAIDFCVPVARIISEHGLTPVILQDSADRLAHFLELEGVPYQLISTTGRTRLNEIVTTVQSACLGIYRVDETAAPDAFLALGVSIGLNRPGLLIHRFTIDPPRELRGLNALKFDSYTGLEESFPRRFGHLLRRYC